MSRNDGSDDGALACKHCGAEAGNAGALARHEQACEGDGGEPDSAALRADDVEIREIANTLPNLREADLRATCEAHGHEPADGDTLAEAAAKALIRAKSGGREAYVAVFGKCDEDGCEYGRNGFATRKCKRHERDDAGEAEPETEDSGESEVNAKLRDENAASQAAREACTTGDMRGAHDDATRAAYVAALMDAGASPREAEAAAEARYGE